MKRLLSSLFAVVLAAPVAVHAAQFEGKVAFKISPAKGQPMEMVYNIKGDKQRLEIPGQATGMGGMIFDTTKKELTILVDAQHMYMVQPMPQPGAAASGDKTGEAPTLEKTGEKETILGYVAEKFVSTSQGAKTELWLAEGLGTFMSPNGGGPMGGRGRGGRGAAPAGQAWERALAGKDLFPLRVVSHDKDGGEFRMEATSIEKKSLPDSLFAPPADYQKFDMANMMKGMMPGGGRP
jgi:hypothetical protein